jgi:hypothetical protein
MNNIYWQIDSTLIITLKPQDYSVGSITPLATGGLTGLTVLVDGVDNTNVLTFTDTATGIATVVNVGGVITITISPTIIPTIIAPCSRYTLVLLANYSTDTVLVKRVSLQTYT